ncbi:hypothetical protein [Rhodopila sp.]|uniref:Nmad3 family putative nucleotide modification protein n=1 Tax=Rhodopila sp. TaxID=2480087 RepID=UPI003D0B87A0
MRLIFSRKGFDGTAGGCASPIVDDRPVSLPIPTRSPTSTCYGDLLGAYGDLVQDLTSGRITRCSPCHLDPDIRVGCLPRLPGWRGCLGQVGAARSHLVRQGVGPGDLFLFWGRFRPARRISGRWTFHGLTQHRIFGWLQVGEVIELGPDGAWVTTRYPWLSSHPHARAGWPASNGLYVGAETLDAPGVHAGLPGWGTFARGYGLTAPNANPSVWSVPKWLNPAVGGAGMTYHASQRWHADGTVKTVAQGQEFVSTVDGSPEVSDWLVKLFEDAS